MFDWFEKGWMGVMMFYEIEETINGTDEVWSRVQQKYAMSRIIQKLQLLNEK